ncbi:hypothetical protein HK105_207369 [Polyrhizophydium stewartii]|uniref:Ankyrin repeat protein n=1 Tax=Polyrhizophydium stewartii TaxID=2732419 RepID=A0ABR4N0R9_9FUNG|nr:hypothetical protein HK105_005428 [Polyrhizophydium stewartii]
MTYWTERSLAAALAADPADLVARLNNLEDALLMLQEQKYYLYERLASESESPLLGGLAGGGDQAARIRSTATNEWDRMPTKIQNKILAHAGALTQFVNNRIENLDWWRFIQIVSDAFELDWQGDLLILPFEKFKDNLLDEPFWLLHTRSMYVRVKALGLDFLKDGLDQAAILNWWIDLLDFKAAQHLSHMAARCGSIAMLKHLVDERRIAALDAEHAQLAVCFGHLGMLKWLAKRMPNGTWTAEVMDWAAGNNALDCVKWLHANRTEGCTTDAMDWAAQKNCIGMLEWLHACRVEGCTTDAMDLAAERGHLWIVGFLHNNRTEGCTSKAMLKAAENGHASIVMFLHKCRREGVIADAAQAAARHGRLAVIMCIHSLVPEAITVAVMRKAIEGGHVDVLEWMLDNTGVRLTSDHITCAVKSGQLHLLSWFRKRVPGMLRAHKVSKIGAQQADSVIEWFGSPDVLGSPTPADVMRVATRLNKVAVMRWLLWHLPDTKWHNGDIELARELISAA